MNVFTSVLGYVVTSIFALEQAMPQSGLGTTKKQIVLNGVETLLKATTLETATLTGAGSNVATNAVIGEVSKLAGGFIDSTVTELNQAKVFVKKAA